MTASLIVNWDAENGVVGQKPPSPLTAVTGPNIPLISSSPVYAGTKSYEVFLDKNQPTILGAKQNPYRTEMVGGVLFQFDRIYWLGISFRYVDWANDTSAENFPLQIHETPSNWTNWGKGDCQQSAASTAPLVIISQNSQIRVKNLTNTLWTKPVVTGVWHTLVFQFKISKTANGFIRSWYDGVEQPRHPTSGFIKTHRADSELNAACTPAGEPTVTFITPKPAFGIYKWDWKIGSTQTSLTTRRLGYLDQIKIAQDIAGDDDAGGYAMVNPIVTVDTVGPVISSINNTSVNANTRRITWTTNENSTTRVDYGTTTSYASTLSNTNLVTAHSLDLVNLAASTLYNYRVRSTDAAGNETISANGTFTTAALTDSISNIVATPGVSGVTITWTTNEARSSIVDYGTTTSYGTNVTTGTLVTSHSKTITGLTAGTTYHYKLSGVNGSSSSIATTDLTFTTTSTISNINVTVVLTDSFRVDWNSTNTVVPSVRYGLTSSYGNIFTKPVAANTAHSCRLLSLNPGTTYHYQVGSLDDNIWSSDQVITLTSLTEAINGIVLTHNSPTSVTLTWTTTGSLDSTVKFGLGQTLELTPVVVGTLVTSHSVTLSTLTGNTTYYYQLRSAAPFGAVVESSIFTFKTRPVSGGRSDSF